MLAAPAACACQSLIERFPHRPHSVNIRGAASWFDGTLHLGWLVGAGAADFAVQDTQGVDVRVRSRRLEVVESPPQFLDRLL